MSTSSNLASVKWFNNKKGYGFLTDCLTGEDIFVHHSAISVPESVYRTLIQGEYVQYNVSEEKNESGQHLALNVTGVHGGNLLCQLENKRVYLVSTDRVSKGNSHKRGRVHVDRHSSTSVKKSKDE